jgi:hypothetical protein
MKTFIASMALGLTLAIAPAFAADAPAKKPAAGAKFSMGVNGRYHKLHKQKAKLDCGDCHDPVQQDILYLRKDDAMSADLAKVGQVDRNNCLSCHKPGSKKQGKIPSFWGV